MIGLLGKKIGMTQWFDQDGHQVAVTVVECGPCVVKDLKTKQRDGYSAVQLAFDSVKEKRVNRARLGQFKKAGMQPHRFVKEIRTEQTEGLQVGQHVGADSFEVGDLVDIQGISIGRGFQGVVKRHGFKGGEKGHGSMFGRVPGSIGASSFPSRVVKGMKAAGQMGHQPVTVQKLKIVKINKEENLITVMGAVPGVEGGYVVIRTALKKPVERKWKTEGAKEQVPKEEAAQKVKEEAVQNKEKQAPQEATKEASKEAPKEAPQETSTGNAESKKPAAPEEKA